MSRAKRDLAAACGKCGSYCCTYYALPLDEPEDKGDFDDLRWFLMHEGSYVYVEDGDWYLNVTARCRYLLPSGKCRAYEFRPRICREHGVGKEPCEFFSDYQFDEMFTSPEQVEEFAVRELKLSRKDVSGWMISENAGFWKKRKK